MARKKLLYVARPQSGGMLKHLCVLAGYFSMRWDVSIAAPPTVLSQVYRDDGNLKYYNLLLAGYNAPLRDIAASLQLVKICRREKIDLLHAHGFKAAFVALAAAKICRVPLLVTVHNFLLHPEKSIFPAEYYHLALRIADPWVAGYITVSEALRQELAGRSIDPGKIIRIYNGINFREFEPESRNEKGLFYSGIIHSNTLGQAGDVLKIGTAGRLVSQKGIDIFIRAAGRIVSRYDGVYFYIAGEGPERGRLEYLRDLLGLQEKVSFLGNIEKMASFLAGLDIFVLASRSEGLSITLLEAGCAGLPLIASATGGIPEIVRDGETGILVPSEDELSLAEAIISLIEDPKKRKHLGDEAAGDIRKRFSEDDMLKETEKVYDEVLKQRAGNTVCFGKSI
ncbi:MAG: glycosyltransferase family 4 protein [Dethiobacteria bacterium]|jgi:glycosyltransferase involved in cell wall biosynthesis